MTSIRISSAVAAAFFAAAEAAGAEPALVETVRFDAALTNSTGWTYASVPSYAEGYALNSLNSLVESPEFAFCATSVVLVVSATAGSTRSVVLRPVAAELPEAGGVCVTNTPAQGTDSTIVAAWDESMYVRSFSVSATKGQGLVYLKSAAVFGAPLLAAPSNTWADAGRYDRVTLRWENPGGGMTAEVEAEKDLSTPFFAHEPFQCDFAMISNSGANPIRLADEDEKLHKAYGELTGENVLAPTNSSGVVQLGTTSSGGWLLFSGVESYASAKLVVRARKHRGDPASRNKMPVFGIYEGVTNELGRVELSDEMADHVLDVAGLPGGTRLLLRSVPSDNGDYTGKGRVLLAYMGVAVSCRRFAEAGASCRLRLVDLSPGTRYMWRVRCRYASGGISPYTDWNVFTTGVRAFAGGTVVRLR